MLSLSTGACDAAREVRGVGDGVAVDVYFSIRDDNIGFRGKGLLEGLLEGLIFMSSKVFKILSMSSILKGLGMKSKAPEASAFSLNSKRA